MKTHSKKTIGLGGALAVLALAMPLQAFDPKAALEQQQEQQEQQRRDDYQQWVSQYPIRINDDGTANVGNLQWMRCSLGQEWTGTTCREEAWIGTWDDAMRLPALLNAQGGFAGHTDWRLPTIDELDTLVRCSSEQRKPSQRPNGRYVEETDGQCLGNFTVPTINQLAFPNSSEGWFWSANAFSSRHAWGVAFSLGHVGNGYGKDDDGPVRLVRGKQ